MILNESQAKAVWDSFCALEAVGTVSLEFDFPDGKCVLRNSLGGIHIAPAARFAKWEEYETQEDFASAYNI